MNIDGKHAIGSAPRWRGRVRRSPTSPHPSRQGPRSCETTVRARHGGLCARWAQAEARTCSQWAGLPDAFQGPALRPQMAAEGR